MTGKNSIPILRASKRKFLSINFSVSKGEVIGIIGRNGSGKSTLLQLISNTLTPTSGKIQVHGRITALLELGAGFNPEFTGRENVYMNGAILGLSREQMDDYFAQIEAFADIGDFIDQPVKIYSSGMMVRLAFAVSAHVDADILIIDEALAVGDIAFQFKCLHRMEELLEKKTTILLVSHDIQLVKSYCHRAIYLKNGQLAYDGACEKSTELFLMDMRIDQQASSTSSSVEQKAALNDESGFAFGSDSGRIIDIEIGSGAVRKNHFASGEKIQVKVTAQVSKSIRNPLLALVIRDARGYNLFAYDTAFAGVRILPDPDGIIKGTFGFICRLQEGNYSLTLRLDDYQSESLNLVLDKQVNVAQFKVLTDGKHFNGVVDLSGEFTL